jgi:SAM-dependent methyltransferase
MTALAERYRSKYFCHDEHPYRRFEREVAGLLLPTHTLLDAGCGRTAPVLTKYRGSAHRLIGIDLVDFTVPIPGVELYKRDLSSTGLEAESVDLIMSRSVVEHIREPAAVLSEFARILRPGGRFVFLTANLWDYASLVAAVVPNRLHPWIVAHTEGREEHDVFPVEYRCNTRRAVMRAASIAGLSVQRFDYLGQYPSYFMFNGALFLLATAYEKFITAYRPLHWLRGWILCTLAKPERGSPASSAAAQ